MDWPILHPRQPKALPLSGPHDKLCRTCDTRKLHAEFAPDARSKDGMAWRCRDCARRAIARWCSANIEHQRDKARAQARKFRAANPAYMRDYMRATRLKKRGLTVEQFNQMIAQQDGLCRICQIPLEVSATNKPGASRARQACVDHDHATGRLRAILCTRCNRGVGMFDDDPELMAKAMAYLREMTDGR